MDASSKINNTLLDPTSDHLLSSDLYMRNISANDSNTTLNESNIEQLENPFKGMPPDFLCLLKNTSVVFGNLTCQDKKAMFPFEVLHIKVIFILLYTLVFTCCCVGKSNYKYTIFFCYLFLCFCHFKVTLKL